MSSFYQLPLTGARMAQMLAPFNNRRLITLGHSLVSQQTWQGDVVSLLGMEGYSFRGISGGTLQPKPGESTDGMFSRAYMAGLSTSLVNQNDGGITTNGLTQSIADRTAATVFWLGANDSITDLANSPRQILYLDGAFIEIVEAKALAVTQGNFADTAAGLSATSVGQFFDTDGSLAGWKILWEHRVGGTASQVYHYPTGSATWTTDRIMTTAEQDEFEARNTADGADAFLSEPLSNGFIPTYEALWHTMIANYLDATGFDDVPEHRFFIVREPQAFWAYDGTMHWPQGHYEKNEIHKRVADRWSIPLIDLWAESGINISTRGWFMHNEASGDLLIHTNDKGGHQCASVIAQRMMQFPLLDFTSDTQGSNLGLPTAASDLEPWNPDNVSIAGQ